MFLSGVDQLVAETRPASLKGILRYWYRILIANKYAPQYGINSSEDWMDYEKWANKKVDNKTLWEKVYEDEGELFGTQDKAGKVWIRMEKIENKLMDFDRETFDVQKWIKRSYDRKSFAELVSYIGYGPLSYIKMEYLENRRENRDKWNKYPYYVLKDLENKGLDIYKVYPKNFSGVGIFRGFFSNEKELIHNPIDSWNVEFILRDEVYKDKLIGFLWFISMFGSLGARSRKGWGSFYLIPDTENNNYGFESWKFESIDTLKRDLKTLREFMGMESIGNIEIYFKKFDVRNMVSFMSEFSLEYKNLLIQELEKVERIIYGLPRKLKGIKVRSNARGHRHLIKWALSYVLDKRRASMIHFKGVEFEDGYGVLIVRKREPLIYSYDKLRDELKEYLIKNLEKREGIKVTDNDKEIISKIANSVVATFGSVSLDESFEKLINYWSLTEIKEV